MLNHSGFPVISISLVTEQETKTFKSRIASPVGHLLPKLMTAGTLEPHLCTESVFINHLHSLFKTKKKLTKRKKKSTQYRRLNNHV